MVKSAVDTRENDPPKIYRLPILPGLKCPATKNVGFGVGDQEGCGVGCGEGHVRHGWVYTTVGCGVGCHVGMNVVGKGVGSN